MRNFRKSWIGIALVILFSLSLFFWRQGSYISNIFNSDNVIAKVGSTTITTTKFNRVLEMNIEKFDPCFQKNKLRPNKITKTIPIQDFLNFLIIIIQLLLL